MYHCYILVTQIVLCSSYTTDYFCDADVKTHPILGDTVISVVFLIIKQLASDEVKLFNSSIWVFFHMTTLKSYATISPMLTKPLIHEPRLAATTAKPVFQSHQKIDAIQKQKGRDTIRRD